MGGKALEVVEIKYSKSVMIMILNTFLIQQSTYALRNYLRRLQKGLNLKQRLFIQVVDAEILPVLISF